MRCSARRPAPTRPGTTRGRDARPSRLELLQDDVGDAQILTGRDLDREIIRLVALSHDTQLVRTGGDRYVDPRRVADQLLIYIHLAPGRRVDEQPAGGRSRCAVSRSGNAASLARRGDARA